MKNECIFFLDRAVRQCGWGTKNKDFLVNILTCMAAEEGFQNHKNFSIMGTFESNNFKLMTLIAHKFTLQT